MTTLHTIASGSEGNCLLVQSGDTAFLVDAGISARRIKTALQSLGLTVDDLAGILLTHAHTDHTCGLGTLSKYHALPLYASAGTAAQIVARCPGAAPCLRPLCPGQSLSLGSATVTPFSTSHDAQGSLDFRVDTPWGSLGILTDTGYVSTEISAALTGVDLLVLESNHDVAWLRAGPYPYPLQERILGPLGHLSNEAAGHFAAEMALRGTKEIVLAHLSRENNTPARALDTVQRYLAAADVSPRLSVAPRAELHRYEVEATPCKK